MNLRYSKSNVCYFSKLIIAATFAGTLSVMAQAPPVTGQNILRQSAIGYQEKIDGALRELISYESRLASMASSGSTSAGSITSVMRSRLGARQRYAQAMVQLMQAQGNPTGIASALDGAFRELLSAEQQLINLNSQPASEARDRQMLQRSRDRNNAQIRVDNQINRWCALINSMLAPEIRTQRQGLTNNIAGTIRELQSIDRQSIAGMAGSGGSATDSLQDQINQLEQRNERDRRQLEAIGHQGSVKASQNPNMTRLQSQISQNERTLENLRQQLARQLKQQGQNEARQQGYVMQNRIGALERYRDALAKVLQFDARL